MHDVLKCQGIGIHQKKPCHTTYLFIHAYELCVRALPSLLLESATDKSSIKTKFVQQRRGYLLD